MFIEQKISALPKVNEQDKKDPVDLSPIGVRNWFVGQNLPRPPYEASFRLSLLSQSGGQEKPHFFDACEISEIMDKMWEKDKDFAQRMKYSALLHDIGKAGPVLATAEEQKAFVGLFNLVFDKKEYNNIPPRDLTIKKALAIKVAEGVLKHSQAVFILKKINESAGKSDLNINENSRMADFWSAHVFWSVELLDFLKIDETVVEIVSGHHFLDGYGPDKKQEVLIDQGKASLIVADQYQALRRRGKLSHEKAVEILTKKVENKLANDLQNRELFLACVQKLAKVKNMIN
ncbi:MAG: hypothetical protein WCT18_02860 [Patescibacteria group bacterium]